MMLFDKIILRVSLVLFGLGVVLFTPNAIKAAEPTENYEDIQKSTVRVVARYYSNGRNRFRYGTGWIIEAADKKDNAGLGTIVTAAHIVQGANRITVLENGSDEAIVSTVKARDRKRDLAFIEVKDLSGTALTLTQVMPSIGAPLKTLGFTSASDSAEQDRVAPTSSIKSGGLSKSFRGDGALDLIEHDVIVNPGYSGGPLIDKCGRIIGLVTRNGGFIDLGQNGNINTAQGVGFGIAANEIVKFAGDENVSFQRDESVCGEKAVAAPAIAKPAIETSRSDASEEKQDTGFSFNQIVATIVIALGLLITSLAVYLFAKKNKGSEEPEVDTSSAPTSFEPAIGGKTGHETGAQIVLSGRDPSGQPIALKFSSNDLQGEGVWVGADPSEVKGHIGDERDNRLISRVHAKIGFDGTSFTIMDNKSTNGTYIGNRKLDAMAIETLQSGDVVKLADISISVRVS